VGRDRGAKYYRAGLVAERRLGADDHDREKRGGSGRSRQSKRSETTGEERKAEPPRAGLNAGSELFMAKSALEIVPKRDVWTLGALDAQELLQRGLSSSGEGRARGFGGKAHALR
jgi:hypothetical protein